MNEAIELISQLLADLSTEDRAALAALLGQAPSPIAIIGTSCRFPGGAENEEHFWELLRDGRDAVREVPRERWDVDAYYDPDPQAPGKMYTRYGGFLDGVDRFDSTFFEISPREARSMDPQQRMLLEVSWEALERAGLAADELNGRPVGVFVGNCVRDYELLMQQAGADTFDAHTVTGGLSSVLPGRISHFLGLHGPAIAIDTACSSSLVATHLACQSLRSGECEIALAAGVNLILAPEGMVMLSRMGALAPDGRCKTFDVRANGFARGEGCGVLVLKRLSDALSAGDDILAVIRGSAVNHDGRSAGLAAPNGIAQQLVVSQALKSAGVSADSLSYLEAHGTGTPLGDPIEIDSLKHLFRARADGSRCSLGSVKTNVGHLEAAAGVVSVIKVALALKNEAIPPHLHFTSLNPRLSLEGSPFVIPTRLEPWPRGTSPRLAGVSSFGLSGTNAHVVLEEAPLRPSRVTQDGSDAGLLTLSAKSPGALEALAERYAALLTAEGAPSLADVAYSANTGRSRFGCRLAVVAKNGKQAAERLRAFVQGREAVGLTSAAVSSGARPRVAFLFGSQSAHSPAAVRGLYDREPVFRKAVDACAKLLSPRLARPLGSWLFEEAGALLGRTAEGQSALFALQVALGQLWIAWGVRPDAVMGDGVGEIAAACVAGVVGLDDALALLFDRGRLAQPLPRDTGCTVFVEIGRGEALKSAGVSSAGISGAAGAGAAGSIFASLTPGQDDARQGMLESLGQLFIRGVKVDWAAFHGQSPGQRVLLPTYPFARERHWIESRPARSPAHGPTAPAVQPQASQLAEAQPSTSGEIATSGEVPTSDTSGKPPLVAALLQVAPAEREAFLLDYVGKVVRTILLLDEAIPLASDRHLDELGMDSLLAIDLVNALSAETGLPLPTTLLVEHPNLGSIVSYVERCLAAGPD